MEVIIFIVAYYKLFVLYVSHVMVPFSTMEQHALL